MPLAMVTAGETVRVSRITGKDEVRQHLAELGFVLGFVLDAEVTVVTQMGGSLILEVKGSRVALDASMASRILVQPTRQPNSAGFRQVAAARR